MSNSNDQQPTNQPNVTTAAEPLTNPPAASNIDDDDDKNFDFDLIKKYPRSNKKLGLQIQQFGIKDFHDQNDSEKNGQSLHISPHGIEFKTTEEFEHGTLLKIMVSLPDYWSRKQKFVNYGRIDNPDEFRVLGKVITSEDIGKRGKKKLVTVQTIIMDDVDEKVLKTFLQDG